MFSLEWYNAWVRQIPIAIVYKTVNPAIMIVNALLLEYLNG